MAMLNKRLNADEEKISELSSIPDETIQNAEQRNKKMGNS